MELYTLSINVIAQNMLKFLELEDAIYLFLCTCTKLRKLSETLNWRPIIMNRFNFQHMWIKYGDPKKIADLFVKYKSYLCVKCGNTPWNPISNEEIPLPSKFSYCPDCYNEKFGKTNGIIGKDAASNYLKNKIKCTKFKCVERIDKWINRNLIDFPLVSEKAYKMGISIFEEDIVFFPIDYLNEEIHNHREKCHSKNNLKNIREFK